jgi:hypothetical protein
MKNRIFAAAIIVAATAVASAPAYSTGVYPQPAPPPKVHKSPPGSSTTGKIIVGCIMGSALGAIGSALRVSRTENRELTQEEAWTALSFCGLGAFALAARPVQAKPQRVVARY